MRIVRTSQVDSHHTNPNYVCLLIIWEAGDLNFRIRNHIEHIADWMPKDDEMKEVFNKFMAISPTFKAWYDAQFVPRDKNQRTLF